MNALYFTKTSAILANIMYSKRRKKYIPTFLKLSFFTELYEFLYHPYS